MDLLDRVNQGWGDHAKDPEGVFARFEGWVDLVTEKAHLAPVAALVAHVAGEHLGRYDAGVALLDRVAARRPGDAATPEGKAVVRQQAALHLAAGRRLASDACEARARVPGQPVASNRVRVAAFAAAMLAGQGHPERAGALLEEALSLADYHPGTDDPAARALAVTGNNVACVLEEKAARSPADDALMVRAAETGLRYWAVAGTWLETERAHYRLAQSLRKARRLDRAAEHATTCLRMIEANGGDAFERFYGHEVVALAHHARGDAGTARAHRDAAASHRAAVEDAELRAMVDDDLGALDRALASPP
jgi:tetratricopeptide (TPR) repeat protein